MMKYPDGRICPIYTVEDVANKHDVTYFMGEEEREKCKNSMLERVGKVMSDYYAAIEQKENKK